MVHDAERREHSRRERGNEGPPWRPGRDAFIVGFALPERRAPGWPWTESPVGAGLRAGPLRDPRGGGTFLRGGEWDLRNELQDGGS